MLKNFLFITLLVPFVLIGCGENDQKEPVKVKEIKGRIPPKPPGR